MTTIDLLDLDRLLLPDRDTWGRGYGYPGYTDRELEEIARNVGETTQPGYGPRLHTTSTGYHPGTRGGARASVPAGFDAVGHPNRAGVDRSRVDPDVATATSWPQQLDPRLQEYFQARGWVLDQHGRPLHPHYEQLLRDSRIEMPTGLGYGWWYGETAVADAVVTVATGHVQIVPRTTDQGTLPSLPGGYSIPADFGCSTAQWRAGDRTATIDGLVTAAARKVTEESGLVLPRHVTPWLVRAIRPVSSPHTLHAWTATYTVRIPLPGPDLPALDRATGAEWVHVDQLHVDVLPRMWPDHQRAVLAAIE